MATTELGPGVLLGDDRYRLERILGAGGMAIVWLAGDERLGRPVAVKVLADVLAADAAYLRRFEREARIAAKLSHPNLVRLFDYSADAKRPFLVMEYVEGATLADLLGQTTERAIDAERVARELLAALGHVHAAGIVHRDVKPANVLIDKTGRVKLTDLGIAQSVDSSRLTRTGNVIGTLRYLAPEVIEGEQATERSDLYSAGVLLREVLRVSPSAAVARLSERLAAADPRLRPAHAEEAAALLEQPSGVQTAPLRDWSHRSVVHGTDVTSVLADSVSGRADRPAARGLDLEPRWAAAAVAVVAVGLLALVLALSGGGEPDRGSTQPAPPETPAPTAPLEEQLRGLEQAIGNAER